MENGGNAKVNAIFEATLAQSGRKQPSHLADGPTRERFIRDKYERRKFYDPAGFSMQTSSAATAASQDSGRNVASQSRHGAPSDAARRRVASRQAQMKPVKSNVVAPKAPAARVAQAPVSAPVEFDLLDFGSETTTTTTPGQTSSGGNNNDLFSSQPASFSANPATQEVKSPSGGMAKAAIPQPPKSGPPATSSTSLAQELLNNPTPAPKSTTSNDDIMALFGPSKQQQNQQAFGFGMQAMNQMTPNNGIASQQPNQNHQGNMMAFNNQQNMMSQQQQQMMMMMQNSSMMPNGNQMMPNQMMPNRMMPNQMMQQQMMRQQMMMQQQQNMANQVQSNNSGAAMNMGMYNSGFGGASNTNNGMNSTIQGMQNLNMGSTTAQQTSDDGGFGTPMGGGQQQTMKKDAFSSLGGMNAFR